MLPPTRNAPGRSVGMRWRRFRRIMTHCCSRSSLGVLGRPGPARTALRIPAWRRQHSMQKESRLLRIGRAGAPAPSRKSRTWTPAARRATLSCTPSATCRADLAPGWPPSTGPHVAYHELRSMLADPQVEAVVIGVADQFHVPLTAAALEAGKHVLVEKPLGTQIEECQQLRRRWTRVV